jgi:hypothetical protein
VDKKEGPSVTMSINLSEVFFRFEDAKEHREFGRIDPKDRLHVRRDLCAFLLLDRLVPGDMEIIRAAQDDEIWLETDCDKLSEVATEADILMLVRCGVEYNERENFLVMVD